MFENSQDFNHNVLYPAAEAYNNNVPESVRDRIDAFTTNLAEPMIFANNILQLRPEAAATTLGRFAMNSTLGIGGLFDLAATEGMAHQTGELWPDDVRLGLSRQRVRDAAVPRSDERSRCDR